MTAHDHATRVPGCFRCETGADEVGASERDEVTRLGVILHDVTCHDTRCEPQAFDPVDWKRVDAIIAAGYKSPAQAKALLETQKEELAAEFESLGNSWGGERAWLTTGNHIGDLAAHTVRKFTKGATK